ADQGKHDLAIAEYRKAVKIDPKFVALYSNLGTTLWAKGRFVEALAVYREWQNVAGQNPKSKEEATRAVTHAERLVELDRTLPRFRKGDQKPPDANQALLLRYVCSCKEMHAASVRFARDAFAADPKLAENLETRERYNAACSAALAGCGTGGVVALPGFQV